MQIKQAHYLKWIDILTKMGLKLLLKEKLDYNSDVWLYLKMLKSEFGCRIMNYTLSSEVSLFISFTIPNRKCKNNKRTRRKSQVFRWVVGGVVVDFRKQKYIN